MQGYFLLYESMLDSVIFARDKYLSPAGVCMPDKMVMYLALLDDSPVRPPSATAIRPDLLMLPTLRGTLRKTGVRVRRELGGDAAKRGCGCSSERQ